MNASTQFEILLSLKNSYSTEQETQPLADVLDDLFAVDPFANLLPAAPARCRQCSNVLTINDYGQTCNQCLRVA